MDNQTITYEYLSKLNEKPLLELVYQAATVHRKYHKPNQVQLCTLLSVKTGGCPEDCSYCPQAARYNTDIEKHKLLDVEKVLTDAFNAKENGSTRFCMGAAWREVKDNKDFDNIIEMVKGVKQLGLEACCTLGMLTLDQAKRLKEAGLTAYNHNLDTSDSYYNEIISTREYNDRLQTLKNVSEAGISTCCGGIIGMGESKEDRIKLIETLANLDPQPESVPINKLIPVPGTPLMDQQTIDTFDWIRMIALARIAMPKSKVRLSAGRVDIPKEAQAMAFLAGANSIFTGETLLTADNPEFSEDHKLINELNLEILEPKKEIAHT